MKPADILSKVAALPLVAKIAIGATTIIVVGAGVQAAMPDKPTVQGFCGTYKTEAARLEAKYRKNSANAYAQSKAQPLMASLSETGNMLQMEGDMVVLFNRLDKAAPEEIEPEVAAVRDTFKQQADQMAKVGENPLGAITGAIINGAQNQGSLDQVVTYIKDKCGASLADPSTVNTYKP